MRDRGSLQIVVRNGRVYLVFSQLSFFTAPTSYVTEYEMRSDVLSVRMGVIRSGHHIV
jgi:hypothetical protein